MPSMWRKFGIGRLQLTLIMPENRRHEGGFAHAELGNRNPGLGGVSERNQPANDIIVHGSTCVIGPLEACGAQP